MQSSNTEPVKEGSMINSNTHHAGASGPKIKGPPFRLSFSDPDGRLSHEIARQVEAIIEIVSKNYSEQLSNMNLELHQLQREQEELLSEREALRKLLDDSRRQGENLQDLQRTKDHKINELKEFLQKAERQNLDLLSSINEIRHEANVFSEKNDHLLATVAKKDEEYNTSKKDYGFIQNDLRELQHTHEKTLRKQQDLNEQIDHQNERVQFLSKALEIERQEAEGLGRKIKNFENIERTLRNDIERITREKNFLNEQCKKKNLL
jgi:chromosome segregation ATPase